MSVRVFVGVGERMGVARVCGCVGVCACLCVCVHVCMCICLSVCCCVLKLTMHNHRRTTREEGGVDRALTFVRTGM